VAWLGHVPMVLVSNDRWPYKSLNDLSTAKTPIVNYGSSGINTASHINGELLALHFGRDFTHIPYKGASAVIPNLLGYQIDISFNFLSSVQPYIESNKLIPLAIVNDTRIDSLPNTPTFRELGIDQPWLRTWYVLLANKNADEKEIAEVQRALTKILKQPATQKILREHGYIIRTDQITMSKTMVSNEIKSFSRIKNKISGAK
jgi:tripartite-type tricarboxylate transporter receptor subunit TctC